MNPISALIVASSISVALWPAADAFSDVYAMTALHHAQNQHAPILSRGIIGHARIVGRRRSYSSQQQHLCMSKYPENAIEEAPRLTSTNGSPATSSTDTANGDIVVEENNNNQIASTILNLDSSSDRTLGILVLLTVPLAWGTYTPVVKYMYEKMDPSMPGFVFSAGYYLVAAVSLGILANSSQDDFKEDEMPPGDNGQQHQVAELGDENDNASLTARGGWELGSYLFIGNGFQVVGLQTVPADRAAFLVQLTTVLVPLVSALSAGTLSAVPLPTWIACIVAFAGVIVMGEDDRSTVDSDAGSSIVSDGGGATEGALFTTNLDRQDGLPFFGSIDMDQITNSLHMSQGDFLIVLAALAYTMHVVRLGAYAPRTIPLKLAASKASTEAFLSVTLVAALAFIGSTHFPSPEFVSRTGTSVAEYFTTIISAVTEADLPSNQNESSLGVSIAAILWTGWVTCAYTIYAQSFGQRRVNPTDSNLIYTVQPLFSSLFAYFLLGETLGFYGYVGATLIGAALLLVTLSDSNDS